MFSLFFLLGEGEIKDRVITHERFARTSDPSISVHLHYPNDFDGPLNEAATDRIRQYHTDYNNRPSNSISFIPPMTSTSDGRTFN
jgi:hypothetical protein